MYFGKTHTSSTNLEELEHNIGGGGGLNGKIQKNQQL